MNLEVTVIFLVFTFVFYMWVRWRLSKLRLFKELGIPGPPPHFLFGNILELNRKGPFQCYQDWIEKYGKIVGVYHGLKPMLLVADPDLLRKIFIKDFHLFSDRPEGVPLRVHSILDPVIPGAKLMDNLLVNLKAEKWKEVRSILTPTFSANKLKAMIPSVTRMTETAISIFEKESADGKPINVVDILQRLTLDIICAQAFAMNIDTLNNPEDSLLRSAKVIFNVPFTSKIVFFGQCFPELGFWAMLINFLTLFIRNNFSIPPLKITQAMDSIIQRRRDNPDLRRSDLLQLLIDASASDDEDKSMQDVSQYPGGSKPSRKNLNLTDLEIKAGALVVFLAGYESTSSSLSYGFHILKTHPELQQKMREEIDLIVENKGHLDFSNASNLQFLERFLLETIRLYPPAGNLVRRVAVTDVDYGNVRIPKGMEIVVPVPYIHHSEEFWDQPYEFNPDRFLPENRTKNHAISYWAFGAGPRSCIGARLVYLTVKIILAKILQKFTIHPVDSQTQVKSKMRILTMVPEEVFVKLKIRSPEDWK